MSNDHVDYMLYDLARAAILARIVELTHSLRETRDQQNSVLAAQLQAQRLQLWRELHEIPTRKPKVCAAIVRKYSNGMVRAQAILNELNRLHTN